MANTQALKTHDTFPNFLEDIKNPTGATPLSYSGEDLAEALIANAASPLSSRLTNSQQELWTTIQNKTEFNNNEEVRTALQSALEIIDDAFYFGTLKNRVELDLRTGFTGADHDDDPSKHAVYEDFWSVTVEKGARTPSKLCPKEGQKPRLVLWLFHDEYLRMWPEMELDHGNMQYWISTVIHELLHAFLNIHTCECFRSCHKIVKDSVLGKGIAGHGTKWCEPMAAIRDSMRRDFSWPDKFDFAIPFSVYEEITWSGWQPTPAQFEHWHLQQEMVDRALAASVNRLQETNVFAQHKKYVQDWLDSYDAADEEGKRTQISLLLGVPNPTPSPTPLQSPEAKDETPLQSPEPKDEKRGRLRNLLRSIFSPNTASASPQSLPPPFVVDYSDGAAPFRTQLLDYLHLAVAESIRKAKIACVVLNGR